MRYQSRDGRCCVYISSVDASRWTLMDSLPLHPTLKIQHQVKNHLLETRQSQWPRAAGWRRYTHDAKELCSANTNPDAQALLDEPLLDMCKLIHALFQGMVRQPLQLHSASAQKERTALWLTRAVVAVSMGAAIAATPGGSKVIVRCYQVRLFVWLVGQM